LRTITKCVTTSACDTCTERVPLQPDIRFQSAALNALLVGAEDVRYFRVKQCTNLNKRHSIWCPFSRTPIARPLMRIAKLCKSALTKFSIFIKLCSYSQVKDMALALRVRGDPF
jgi:hypothetical protein